MRYWVIATMVSLIGWAFPVAALTLTPDQEAFRQAGMTIYMAAPERVQKYFTDADNDMIKLAMAFRANVCRYRSDGWYQELMTTVWNHAEALQVQHGVTKDDYPTINKMNELIFKHVAGAPHCEQFSLGMLNYLDQFWAQMTLKWQ